MEMIAGWTHKAFPIDDASRTGEARRHGAGLAAELGWSDVDATRLALVITELGTNLQRHATKGRLLIASRPQTAEVEVLSLDEGPGMPDLPLAMRDGHSSSSTPGNGLGAVRRLANDFDIHSAVPEGTVIVARVRDSRTEVPRSRPALEVGAICLPVSGELVCGDGWMAATDDDRMTLMLSDGLGHGLEAHKASRAAAEVFAKSPQAPLPDMLQRMHENLQSTRGAAICVANIDVGGASVQYAGAGNIVGRVLSGVFDKSIVTQHGTAGMQIRKPVAASLDLPPHALVVLHSDGIATRWTIDRIRPVLQRDPTLVAGILLRDHTRHRDDATVVVIRRKE